jgi:hypothetical protein
LYGIPLAPVDLGLEASCYNQHAVVAVQARDLACGRDTVCSRAGQHPRPTADIEHTIRRGQPCGICHTRRPLAKNGRNKTLLVDFSRVPRDLPAFGFRHRFLASSEDIKSACLSVSSTLALF